MKRLLFLSCVILFATFQGGNVLAEELPQNPGTTNRANIQNLDGETRPTSVTGDGISSSSLSTGASGTSSSTSTGSIPNERGQDEAASGGVGSSTNTTPVTSPSATTSSPTDAINSPGTLPSLPVKPTERSVPVVDVLDQSSFSNLLETFIPRVIDFVLGITAIVTVFVVIWGGYLFFTAMGDSGKVEEAIKTIQWGTTGLTVALLAYIIVQVVVNIRLVPGI